MTTVLRQKYHLRVSRDQVMILLRECDPEVKCISSKKAVILAYLQMPKPQWNVAY